MSTRTLADAHRELEGLVGAEGPEFAGTLARRDVARFAIASGEADPIYTNPKATRAAGYDEPPCPPLMLTSVIEWGEGLPLARLRVDGTGGGPGGWLPLEGLRLMGGGQDLIFHRRLFAGALFVARPRLESVELKGGERGRLVLMVITTDYHDARGAPLVTCRETLIAR
jgi:hypothetical protein